jgi:CRISPR/Cas system-associated exonuclease Cas4 (RecB family)
LLKLVTLVMASIVKDQYERKENEKVDELHTCRDVLLYVEVLHVGEVEFEVDVWEGIQQYIDSKRRQIEEIKDDELNYAEEVKQEDREGIGI